MRRTFVCLGDAVNLAARLMSKAPRGRDLRLASASAQAAGDALHLGGARADLTRQGQGRTGRRLRADRLARAAPRGARSATSCRSSAGRAELAAARRRAREVASPGAGRIVGIAAEAGMGKSRLVAEFVRIARRRRPVRRRSASASPSARTRLLRLARDLAAAAAVSTTTTPRRAQLRRARGRARGASIRRSSRARRSSTALLGLDDRRTPS